MKSTFVKTTVTVFFLAVLTASSVLGQQKPHENPKYGQDSATRMECVKNISLYSEFYKQKNYNDAVKPWREVLDNCPKASKNTYLRGATIYKNLIAREKDLAKKDALIDTLMIIYDKRIENFGQEATVLGYKGLELYSYRKNTAALEVAEMLKKSCELGVGKTKSAVVSTYMQATVDLYRAEQNEGADVIEAYTISMSTLEAAVVYNKKLVAKGGKYAAKGQKELANIETATANVDALFSESGAADCDALAEIFAPKYEESMNDVEWLKKVTKLLNKYDCTDKEIFAKSAEQLNKLEPSAEAAHNLARLFLKKQDYTKAESYYEEATSLQEDSITKALYYYEWSTLARAQENYPKVRKLSNSALKYNPNDGRPYIMIGLAYAQTKGCGKESVEHNAVFWAAVDMFAKAKKVDSSLATQANEYIATYSKYFPNFEEWFMAIGTKEGDKYTVGCWLNVTTTVRF